MTKTEAYRIIETYWQKLEPDEDDDYYYTEALNYLIKEENDPEFMMNLGGFYYTPRVLHLII